MLGAVLGIGNPSPKVTLLKSLGWAEMLLIWNLGSSGHGKQEVLFLGQERQVLPEVSRGGGGLGVGGYSQGPVCLPTSDVISRLKGHHGDK